MMTDAEIKMLTGAIVDDLFTEAGTDRRAARLVMEMPEDNWSGHPGWSANAVAGLIERKLRNASPQHQTA